MMKRIPKALLAAGFLILISVESRSNGEPLRIGTYLIPGYVNSTNEGKYIHLYREIERRFSWSSQLLIQPTKRVHHNFKNGSLIGYFPALREHKPSNFCLSEPFDQKTVYAFNLRGRPLIQSISDLEGIRLGAVVGYAYGSLITENPKLDITKVRSDFLNVKMLMANHVDAILGDSVVTIAAISQLQASKEIQHDPDSPLSILDIFFAFKNNSVGVKFCEEASVVIREQF